MTANNFKKFVTNPVNFSLGVREIKKKIWQDPKQAKDEAKLDHFLKKKKLVYM